MKPINTVTVVLNLPRHIPDFIVFARKVGTGMRGNPDFPSPNPPIAELAARADALETAELLTLTRAIGSVQDRDVKFRSLHAALKLERAYVQDVANANPDRADAIVASAGMGAKKKAVRVDHGIVVKAGDRPGSVVAVTRSAGRKATYEWDMTTDGTVWTALPFTLLARTTIDGLTRAREYWLRVRVTTVKQKTDWSPSVSFVVG